MTKSIKIWVGLIFLVLLDLIIWLYHIYTMGDQRTIFNLATLLGFYVSIYGLAVALWQIFALQNQAEQAQKTITETRTKIDHILSLSDCAKSIGTIRTIKENINNGKYELAMLRLCEVKDFMMRIKYVSNITYNEEELSRLINMTILHLNNLNKQINKIKDIDKIVFCRDLENIASVLINLEYQLKNK